MRLHTPCRRTPLPCGQAKRLDGKAPLPLYGLAQVHVRQRDYGRAVPLLEEALALVRAHHCHLPALCSVHRFASLC